MATEFLETFDAPYYVVLGHRDCKPAPKVYSQTRPAGITATFKHLVPIIVVCTNRQDADLIFEALQPVSFANIEPDDAHTMVYSLQHTPATTIHRQLQVSTPMFAIQTGVEPAIYIGYEWENLRHNIEIKTPRPSWKGYPDGNLSAALIFMLKKPGAKLPLLPMGSSLYPPPVQTPAKELRFDLSNLSIASSGDLEGVEQSSSPARAASPEKRGTTASQSSSPTKRATRANAAKSAAAQPAPGSSGSSSSSRSSSSSSVSSVSSVSTASTIVRSLPTPYGVGAPVDPVILMLRRFIRRPDSMGRDDNPRLPPINFGSRADDFFLRTAVDSAELLSVLQVLVHSDTVETFTHHMGLTLGWSTRDAAQLWRMLELPEL